MGAEMRHPVAAGRWHVREQGRGRPLVLLHGLGMTHAAWTPVMDRLSAERRVLAFDVAGFGLSPTLPPGMTPDLPTLAQALAHELEALGLREPVDVAGNSMGGGIALALALQGRARSVAALSPAGLWPEHGPAHTVPFLRLLRATLQHARPAAEWLLGFAPARAALLSIPLSPRGDRIPARVARQQVRDLAAASGFKPTLDAIGPLPDLTGLQLPIHVAFGRRDWLLTAAAQRRDRLPPQTVWSRPRGWGHVPMWDDPEGVAGLILAASA